MRPYRHSCSCEDPRVRPAFRGGKTGPWCRMATAAVSDRLRPFGTTRGWTTDLSVGGLTPGFRSSPLARFTGNQDIGPETPPTPGRNRKTGPQEPTHGDDDRRPFPRPRRLDRHHRCYRRGSSRLFAMGRLIGGQFADSQDKHLDLAGSAFLICAAWTLAVRNSPTAKPPRPNTARGPRFWPWGPRFVLAKLGDKTVLATLTSATKEARFGTCIGSTLGMVLADALPSDFGAVIGSWLPDARFATEAQLLPLSSGGPHGRRQRDDLTADDTVDCREPKRPQHGHAICRSFGAQAGTQGAGHAAAVSRSGGETFLPWGAGM
jgi:hypothetical protein